MDITPLIPNDRLVIQAYAGGGFRIGGRSFQTPVIVLPDRVLEWNAAGIFPDMQEKDFTPLIALAPELDVVLMGCGPRMAFLPPPLKAALAARGLRLETMDTGAACRTYNVLMAEGRRIAAALLPV